MIKKIKKISVVKVTDLRIPFDYDLDEIGITQSLLKTSKCCSRKFLYKINRYYHESETEKFLFGNIIHYCLDKLYSLLTETDKIIDENMLHNIILNFKKDNNYAIQGIQPDIIEHTISKAEVVLREYIKVYKKDFTVKNFTDVEKEITQTLENFKCLSKIDGKFENKKKAWLIEHKTKGRISEESLMQRLSYDYQNLTYLTVAEAYYNEQIEGILYNVIRNPQIKPKKKQNETLQEFYIRLKKDIIDRPEFYFMRYEIPYTKKTKHEHNRENFYFINELKNKIELAKENPSEACFIFGKNDELCEFPFPCKFIQACSSGTMVGYKQHKKVFIELDSINY